MAWYNSILGNNIGNAISTSTTTSVGTGAYPNTGIAISNGGAGNSFWGSSQYQSQSDYGKVQSLQLYCEAINWSLSHLHIPDGVTSNDPKVSILKLTPIGEVIKDVGMRSSMTDFWIMREPGA